MVPSFVRLWRVSWMVASTIATATIVATLLWPPPPRQSLAKPSVAISDDVLRLDRDEIVIPHHSPLQQKLGVVTLTPEEVSFPVLRVTGSIVARLVPDSPGSEHVWKFSTDQLSATYANWLKSQTEIENAQQQLAKVRELANSNMARHKAIVSRLKRLVALGTEAAKDLTSAEADLVQAELEGQRDVYAAETMLTLAKKSRASLERQLEQDGLATQVFADPEDETVLMVANVPEQRMSLVKEGQSCRAELYGFPNESFAGHVERIAATLSADRRAMRVLFHLTDSSERLRPGMFAEIGLGTDKRRALLLPPEAILHVGNSDYVLVEHYPGRWRITPCVAGEAHGGKIEITSGLASGERIIARGAILLKPIVVQAKSS